VIFRLCQSKVNLARGLHDRCSMKRAITAIAGLIALGFGSWMRRWWFDLPLRSGTLAKNEVLYPTLRSHSLMYKGGGGRISLFASMETEDVRRRTQAENASDMTGWTTLVPRHLDPIFSMPQTVRHPASALLHFREDIWGFRLIIDTDGVEASRCDEHEAR